MQRHHFLIVLLLIFSGLSATTLSLDEARKIALENNHDYQSKREMLKAATWQKRAALGSMLPSLNLDGSYMYSDPASTIQAGTETITLNNDARSISLSLTQPIFMGGKLWQSYRMSKTSEDIAELELLHQELTLISEVESKYLSVQLTQELYNLSEIDLRSAKANLELAQIKYNTGIISQAEYLQLQATSATKEVAVLQAKTQYQLTQRDFANYLGISFTPELEGISLEVSDSLVQQLCEFDLDMTNAMIEKAQAFAKRSNLNLAISDKNVELSERAYSASKGSFLPTVTLTGSRIYTDNGLGRYDFDTSNQIMLTASIPILPQITNYANSRSAYYQYQVAEHSVQQTRDSISLQVESAVLNLISSANQLKAATIALEYTEQTYEQMYERYRQNMISSSELIDIELMLNSARTSKLNSIQSFQTSKTSLLQTIGSTDTNIINQLIPNTKER